MKPKKTIDKLSEKEKTYLKKKFNITAYKDLSVAVLTKLKESVKELTDTRQQVKCQYKMWDVIVCVIIAVLCGKKDWEEIHDFVVIKYKFFRKFLKMTGGIPCAKTYERIMSIVNYKELEKIVLTFFSSITKEKYEGIEILNFDGRVNNGSKRNETIKSAAVVPLNVLNVYSNKNGLCISSEIIDSKTNEIPKTEDILKILNVKDTIVTWDALNTQKANIAAAREAQADYVVPVKSNHPTFYQELIDYFDEEEQAKIIAGRPNTGYLKNTEYKNGTSVIYEYFQTRDINWYEDKDAWKDLKTIGMVKKTITKKVKNKNDKYNEETTVEYRYYISNLDIDIKLFSTAIRKHWSIENKLHWHLDVTFRLDKNRTLDKNALMNLEIVNKLCLGILNRVQKSYGMSLKRIINNLSLDVEENILELFALLALADGGLDNEI